IRSRTSAAISSGSGPLLPMQVVHPYPTRLNPSASRYVVSPARFRYSVTTFEPGARLVLTHGRTVKPRSTAFRASSPAAIITLGFEVFVQLVIAAITTDPCSSVVVTASATAAPPLPPAGFLRPFCRSGNAAPNDPLAFVRATRSCGRRGPARLGSIEERSRESESL